MLPAIRHSGVATIALLAVIGILTRTQEPASAQALAPTAADPAAGFFPQAQIAGAAQPPRSVATPDPYSGNPSAIEQGRKLFVAMNCAGCHGYDAAGGMGPNLTDKDWRHGGAPASVYVSIAEGHAEGMPAWGRALPPASIWSLVAYLESLGGTFPPGGYNASLQGDRDNMVVAPGAITMEELMSGQPAASPPAPAAGGSADGDAAKLLSFGPRP